MSKVVESFEAIVKFTPQSTMRMDGDVHTVHTNETLIRPLVRCKDCKFWHEVDTMNVLRYGECDRLGSAIRQDCFVNENWFCADGERKEQDDEQTI